MGQSSKWSGGRVAAVALVAVALTVCVGCDCGQRRALESLHSASATERIKGLRLLARGGDSAAAHYVAPLLQDSSRRVRETAAMTLGRLGVGPHMPALIDRLRDPAPEVRLAAIRALGASHRATARRALLPLLDDPSAATRRAATRALEDLGMTPRQQNEAFAAEILQTHIRGLAALQDQVRAESAKELGLSGSRVAVPALLARLAERVPSVLDQVARALALIGGERAVAALQQLAGKKDAAAQAAAARGAAALPAPLAWPILERLLGVSTSEVRRVALSMASSVGGSPPGGVAELLCAALADGDHQLAALAARAVSAHQLPCEASVGVLLARVAEHERGYSRDSADVEGLVGAFEVLSSLGCARCGPPMLRLAQHLCDLYRHEAEKWVPQAVWNPRSEGPAKPTVGPPPRGDRRRAAQWLLSRFPRTDGAKDRDPLLPPRMALERIERLVRATAAYSGARTWLAELALAAPFGLRVAALNALSVMSAPAAPQANATAGNAEGRSSGHGAAAVAEAVRAGMEADSVVVRRAAARALWQLGEAGEGIAMGHLASPQDDLMPDAAWALGRMRSAAAVPALVRLLGEGADSEVVVAIGRIGDARGTAALLQMLSEEHPEARVAERVEVIRALGAIGDHSAAGALQGNVSHPHAAVRLAAAKALSRCGRKGALTALSVCGGDYYAQIREACDQASRAIRGGQGPP